MLDVACTSTCAAASQAGVPDPALPGAQARGRRPLALHAVDPDALLAAASRSARDEPLTGY